MHKYWDTQIPLIFQLMILGVPVLKHYILGHLKTIIFPFVFPFGTNGKIMVLGVPLLKHYILGHVKTINFSFGTILKHYMLIHSWFDHLYKKRILKFCKWINDCTGGHGVKL